MGTSTFEKGGGLIAVTGITQTIAVIVKIVASWTIIIVMHIIITLENGALDVDCRRMMMNKTMMNSIGECVVHLFFQCGVAWSIKLETLSSS